MGSPEQGAEDRILNVKSVMNLDLGVVFFQKDSVLALLADGIQLLTVIVPESGWRLKISYQLTENMRYHNAIIIRYKVLTFREHLVLIFQPRIFLDRRPVISC